MKPDGTTVWTLEGFSNNFVARSPASWSSTPNAMVIFNHSLISPTPGSRCCASISTMARKAARTLAQLGYHLIERGDVGSARERLGEARAIMRRIGLAELAKVEQTLAEL